MNTEREAGHGGPADAEHRQDTVTITVNNTARVIHRGRQTVSEIKRVSGVPQADELAQVLEGHTPPLTPLGDEGSVTITGGEVFVSHPRDRGSSSRAALHRDARRGGASRGVGTGR
jgi:hypothetical protein